MATETTTADDLAKFAEDLANRPDAIPRYILELVTLAQDWDERLVSRERSACTAGASALTVLLAQAQRIKRARQG